MSSETRQDTRVQMYFLKFSNQWFGFDPQSIVVVMMVILLKVSEFWFVPVFKSQKVN